MPDQISKKLYQSIFVKHIRDAIKNPNKRIKSYELIRQEFKEFIKIDINFKSIPTINTTILDLEKRGAELFKEIQKSNLDRDDAIINLQGIYISNAFVENEITLYNQLSYFRDIPESFKRYLNNEGEKISELIENRKSPKHTKQTTILKFNDLEEILEEEIYNYFDWLKEQKDCNFFEISQCMNHTIDHSSCPISIEEASKFGLQVSEILFQSKSKLNKFFISDYDTKFHDGLCKEIWFFSLWFTKNLEFSIDELDVKVTGANGFFVISRECFFSAFMGELCDAYRSDWTDNLSYEPASLLIQLERETVTKNFEAFNNALKKYRDQVGFLSFSEGEIELIGTFFVYSKRYLELFGQGFLEQEFESMSFIPQLSKVIFINLIRQKNEKNIFFIGTGPFYDEPLKFVDDLKEFYSILDNGNHQSLAQSFIILHVLRIFLSVKITDSIWLRIIQLINDTLNQTQKKNIISILNLFAPENSELRIELDNNYQHQNIYNNEVIKYNAVDEASLFYKKILLSQFGKDQILKYFKNLRFNERENLNNHDNILLPLFKAAEDHLSLYLKNQGVEFGRSTDLSNLINRLRDHINISPSMKNFKSKWKKEKEIFYRIIPIRNQTAHASRFFNVNLIEPTQDDVQKLLCFIEELKQ